MTTNQPTKSNAVKDVTIFFVITLGLSYFVFWGPLAFFQITAISFVDNKMGPAWAIALFMLGGFVPSLTAIALTGIKEGQAGLKQIWRRVLQVRIGWRWYAAATGLIVFGSTCQISFNFLLGHSFDFTLFLTQLPSFLPLIVIGPLSEELGWRGYAQTRLQARLHPLISRVIIGIVWALWHLPLFLIPGTSQHELGMSFVSFAFGLIGLSALYAWLQNHTDNSIWTSIYFHWIFTYAVQVIATGITRSPLYNWLEYTPYILAALLIAFVWNKELKSSTPQIK
jgi:membrane protease YdiL (CAAX protease family)